jgi:capsular exopolysaccharide synthesis family protein
MSRHFEALTHLQQQGDGAAGEVWSALESAPRPAQTPVEALKKAALNEEAPASIADGAAAVGSEKLVFDKRARLLPFATDLSVVERYRSLRTKLLQQQAENPFRTVVVTSSKPQEGKSLTVLNLALSCAMIPGYRVLVVDGDLRRGTIGRWLGVDPNQPGFGNLVESSATLEDAVLQVESGTIDFVTRGSSQLPAAELLNSPSLKEQLGRMAQHYDLVLMDSPPTSLVADARLLAANCDAVLLVARAYSTARKSFDKTVQDLSKSRIIGAVLNAAAVERSTYYYYNH